MNFMPRSSNTSRPSTVSTTSPSLRPALSAGPPLNTSAISTPRGRSRPSALAFALSIVSPLAPIHGRTSVPPWTAASTTRRTISAGIAKPMPLEPPPLREDHRVHADQPALHVDERAARVAGVDRGVGLDEGAEVGRANIGARQRGNDAAGDRLADAERVADGEHQIADLQIARIGEVQRRQRLAARRRCGARRDRCARPSSPARPGNSRRSFSTTRNSCAALRRTWLLVTMTPSAPTITPEPSELSTFSLRVCVLRRCSRPAPRTDRWRRGSWSA